MNACSLDAQVEKKRVKCLKTQNELNNKSKGREGAQTREKGIKYLEMLGVAV